MRASQKTFILTSVVGMFLIATRTTPAQGPTSDTAADAVQPALSVHGRQWATGEIADSLSEGKLTFFVADGPKVTFDLKIVRKGFTQVQRFIKQPIGELRQGANGADSWEAIPGFSTPTAQGRAQQFLQSQTARSVQRLFSYQKEGLTLRDLGTQDKAHRIEAEDKQGKKTAYVIDSDTNFITKLEFTTGEMKDPFSGASIQDTDTYVFSDYRLSQGLLTPFKIERYSVGRKVEEMQFTSVKYNAGLKDADFQR